MRSTISNSAELRARFLSVTELGLSPKSERFLYEHEISTIEKLLGAIETRCKWLAYDRLAFLDVWERLALVGLRKGDIQAEWALLVAEPECEKSLDDVAEEMRAICGERGWFVLRLRYGITPAIQRAKRGSKSGGMHRGCTLDDVGRELARSRERVRQLEAWALRKLIKAENASWRLLAATIAGFCRQAGGIVSPADAARLISSQFHSVSVNAAGMCRLLMHLSSEFTKLEDDPDYYREVRTSALAYPAVIETARLVTAELDECIETEDLAAKVQDVMASNGVGASLETSLVTVTACIRAHGPFTIALRGPFFKDLVVDCLQSAGEPVHYRRITEAINSLDAHGRHFEPRAVQGLLAERHRLFTNVRPGVYGLAEWGLTDRRAAAGQPRHTIGDIAAEFLQGLGRVASTNEVLIQVRKYKPSNAGTVHNGLTRDKRFKRHAGGFGLAMWFP